MASKLEYLQRYMSGGSGGAGESKKRRKSKKERKEKRASTLGTRIVDEDHEWEQDAPSRDDIDRAWELDGGQDDMPVVVTEGDDVVEAQDLPVYVNADEFLDELQAKNEAAAKHKDEDLSPPRKPTARRDKGSDDDAPSPPRRPRRRRASGSGDDLSPPRKQKEAIQRGSDSDASPPRAPARRRASRKELIESGSPPRRPRLRETSPVQATGHSHDSHSDSSPPRRMKRRDKTDEPTRGSSSRGRDHERRASPVSIDTARREPSRDNGDASPRRRRSTSPFHATTRNNDRQRRVDSMGRDIVMRETIRSNDGASPPHRRRSPSTQRDRRGRSRSRSNRRHRSSSRDRHSERRRSRECGRDRGRSSTIDRRSRRREGSASPPRRPRNHHEDESRRRRHRSRSRSVSNRHGSRDRHPSRRSRSPGKKEALSAPRSPAREEPKPSPRSKTAERREKDASPPVRAGLFTAKEFERNQKAAARSKDLLHGVDAKDMGANAETVYRDKRGRKLDMLSEMVRQQEIAEGKRKREEREEYEWGTGKVQKQERRSQQELVAKMKELPFARHDDDEELERMRKARVRAFDPMDSQVFKDDAAQLGGDGGSKKHKKSKKGNKNSGKPAYSGPPAPPNRFGIRPGYRWDGVVRGTGWEEKLLLRANAAAATSEDAYRFAVADM